MGFIAITTLVCGLFATRENPVVGTVRFLSGAVWSAVAAGCLDLWIVPYLSDYEELAFVLGIFLFVGGLAKYNPGTAGAAAAYGLLMPNLLMPGNQLRVDEVTFLNTALHTVLAVGLSVLVFRLVLPFNARDERMRYGAHIRTELRGLCIVPLPPSPQWWIGSSVDRIGRLVRHAAQAGDRTATGDIRQTLLLSAVGLNILLLRQLKRQQRHEASRTLTQLMRALARYRPVSRRGSRWFPWRGGGCCSCCGRNRRICGCYVSLAALTGLAARRPPAWRRAVRARNDGKCPAGCRRELWTFTAR